MKTPLFIPSTVLFLIVGLILLSWLVSDHEDVKFPAMTPKGETRDSYQSLNMFIKKEETENYDLTYGWKDFERKSHYISFPLSKKQVLQAEDEFGYFPERLEKHLQDNLEKLREEMVEHLRNFTQELVDKSRYSDYFYIEDVTSQSFNLKFSVHPSLRDQVKSEFDGIISALAKEQSAYFKKIVKKQEKAREQYLEERGIRFIYGRMGVNYSKYVEQNQPRVRHILEILRSSNENLSLHQFLGLMLAFVQEIRYKVPPFSENQKIIMEFWVPPKVLTENFGDCDSKGVTFASLWTNFKKYPILLINVPKHFLIGLAIPPIGRESVVLNGLRFTLCEVTGPGKIVPGLISRYSQICLQNGQFVYELIR